SGLLRDDPNLTQGATTPPRQMQWVIGWACEWGDVIGYAAWQGDKLPAVGAVDEFFARKCFAAAQRLGEPAACRYFLNWFDDTPRAEMRRELLAEVELVLAERFPIEPAQPEPKNSQPLAA